MLTAERTAKVRQAAEMLRNAAKQLEAAANQTEQSGQFALEEVEAASGLGYEALATAQEGTAYAVPVKLYPGSQQ